MNPYQKHFASFDGRIWLNAASEGPLPLAAKEALLEAVEWKSNPYLLTNAKFVSTVVELKDSIGRLIGVNPQEVILANSASYGLHILANGLPWVQGDEILLMQNDFPTDILPWLALEKKGVKVRQLKSSGPVLSPQELSANISAKTKLFCIPHVHTFSGYVLDVEEFAAICRERKIFFIVNLAQSVGTRPVDVSGLNADAVVTAGYKWLCGPYGTGFAWFSPELMDRLDYNQSYWISVLNARELQSTGAIHPAELKGARKYDVFGTANFFNFVPFKASVDLWLEIGLDKVQAYHQKLTDQFLAGLNGLPYSLVSSGALPRRSSLTVFSHRHPENNNRLHEFLLERRIYTAFWKNNIRVSAHVYNTAEEIDQLLGALKDFAKMCPI